MAKKVYETLKINDECYTPDYAVRPLLKYLEQFKGKTKGLKMACLKDIKYLTKKKVLKMQPIYYVGAGLKILNSGGGWYVVKLDGYKLKLALDNFLLYESYRCFTTEQEANDLMNKYNEFIPEPERKPAVNPFASEQIIRTIPEKGIVPLPIADEQINKIKGDKDE